MRMRVEQSYKQVKHVPGWSDYQVRSDPAIRRHWQLVCLAFPFCWWGLAERGAEKLDLGAPPRMVAEDDAGPSTASGTEGRGKERSSPEKVLAGGFERGEGATGGHSPGSPRHRG